MAQIHKGKNKRSRTYVGDTFHVPGSPARPSKGTRLAVKVVAHAITMQPPRLGSSTTVRRWWPVTSMKYFSVLLLVALAASPLSTTADIICAGDGRYTANSTYEANLRRLASTLPAEISSSQGLHTYRAIGYWPNRLRATWGCGDSAGSSPSSCSACIAGGFQESVRECPYRKDFFFSDHNCYLDIAEFRASERIFSPTLTESMALVMALQAVAFAFLLFLFLQEWRHRRGDSMMRSSSLTSGDK